MTERSLSAARARPGGRPDLARAGVRRGRGDRGRDRLHHRDDRLPGDADRPVVPPADRRDDGPAHRQHRGERRGRRVGADLGGRATWCATRPAGRRTGGRAASSTTSWSPQGVVGISGIDTRALTRHLRERGVMRVGLFSGDAARRGAGASCSRRCVGAPVMAGADLGGEVSTPQPYVVQPVASQAVHRRGARPRDQGDDPAPDGRARHARSTCCRPPRRSTTCSRSSPTGCSSPTARVTRRRPTHEVGPAARGARPRGSRSSASASATRCSAGRSGFGTYKLGYGHRGINQPVHGPARPAGSRSPRTTTGSPSTPRSTRSERHPVRPGRGQPRRPQRRRRRGAALPRRPGLLGAVPPGGGRRPARRRLPVRPVRRPDGRRTAGRRAEGRSLMPRRTICAASW